MVNYIILLCCLYQSPDSRFDDIDKVALQIKAEEKADKGSRNLVMQTMKDFASQELKIAPPYSVNEIRLFAVLANEACKPYDGLDRPAQIIIPERKQIPKMPQSRPIPAVSRPIKDWYSINVKGYDMWVWGTPSADDDNIEWYPEEQKPETIELYKRITQPQPQVMYLPMPQPQPQFQPMPMMQPQMSRGFGMNIGASFGFGGASNCASGSCPR